MDHRVIVAEFDGIVNEIIKNLLDLSHVRIDHLDVIRKCKVKTDMSGIAGAFKEAAVSLITRLMSKLVRIKSLFHLRSLRSACFLSVYEGVLSQK